MDRKLISRKSLGELLDKLCADGQRVIAPVKKGERIAFAEVRRARDISQDHIQTKSSAKDVVFPRHEELLRYQIAGKAVQVQEVQPDPRPTVLYGARPCDAASFAVLSAVFTWDSPDAYFQPRLANLTVIGVSCTKADAECFCTSVGGGPGDTRGSDILLTPLDKDQYLAEIITDKGKALAAKYSPLFTAASDEAKDKFLAKVPAQFSATNGFAGRLAVLFGKLDIWVEQSLRCLGCGACAFVCPTCSCFDIQDERTKNTGVRLRCWDACGFSLFTLHASGHNPRSKQSERWRQRIMHKFSYMPERLGVLGCVGCGRCSRVCPADMNLAEHVKALAETKG